MFCFAIYIPVIAILDYSGGMYSFPSFGGWMLSAAQHTAQCQLMWVLLGLLCL